MTPKLLILYLALQWLLALTATAATPTYDADGRLIRMTYADGSTIDYPRDSNGNQLNRVVTRPVELTLTVDPPGSGTVTGAGRYLRNTQQSLTATAGSDFVFAAWKRADGTILSTTPNYTHPLTAPETLTAHFIPLAPEIAIEDPSTTPATDLVDGVSSLSFGSQFLQSTTTKTLTIRNTGNASLTGLSATIDGAALADFTQSTLPTFIAAGGSVTLYLQFSPSSAGTRSATLHIASADTDENPFDVGLNGNGRLLISTFDEDLTFDDNQVPTGWTLGYPVGGPGRNASIINQRFDVRQVDTYGGIDKAKQVPANAGRVVISYTGNITSNYWGQGTQIRFITTSGEFFTTFGKSGYGAATMSAVVGEEGHQPWAFQRFDPLDVGTYRMTAIFEDSRITYKVTKQGASSPLVDEIVSLPTLQIHNLQTLRLFSLTTTGDPSWIDDVTIRAIPMSPSESWRQQYFGSISNTGNGADAATPMHDGIPNLMKFATGMDPTKTGTNPGSPARAGGSMRFTYIRNKTAVLDGLIFVVEWSDTLAGNSWSNAGVSEVSVDQGSTEVVTATLPVGVTGKRFVHLRVSKP